MGCSTSNVWRDIHALVWVTQQTHSCNGGREREQESEQERERESDKKTNHPNCSDGAREAGGWRASVDRNKQDKLTKNVTIHNCGSWTGTRAADGGNDKVVAEVFIYKTVHQRRHTK